VTEEVRGELESSAEPDQVTEEVRGELESSADVAIQPADNTAAQYNGSVAGVVVGVIIVVLLVIAVVLWVRAKKSKSGPTIPSVFGNPTFGLEPNNNHRNQPNFQEMSSVNVTKAGATTGYDNPGFQPPDTNLYNNSKLELLGGPTLAADWPDSPHISRDSPIVVKGCSTPAQGRVIERDSAFIEPSIAASSYDENDQHLSVSFFKDKDHLISSDSA